MAPDASSLASGKKLGAAHKWSLLGRSEEALWGEIKGSGKRPYQVRIALDGPAFKCSCPSRKFPCKHALGLALVHASDDLPEGVAPDWVSDWLADRHEREQAKATRAAPVDDETRERRREAADKRAAAREEKVAAGVDELSERLRDVLRRGLANQRDDSYRYWDDVAARLVDAQAPGLARMVRGLGGMPHVGEGWPGRMLERLARIHLLLEAYRRRDTLGPEERADVRTLIGFPQSREELLAGAGMRDRWWVLGQWIREYEDGLKSQRTWLWGETTARFALSLVFAPRGQPLEMGFSVGRGLDAELVFYPSSWPVRAIVKERFVDLQSPFEGKFTSITEAYAARGAVIARYPWLERFPMALGNVAVVADGQRLLARDERELQIITNEQSLLLALSGGRPIALFGEERDARFFPMTAFVEGRAHALAPFEWEEA